MGQYVYRYNNTAALIEVQPTSSAVTQTSWANLVMPRGVYQYNALKYNFDTDGLYGIFNPGVDGGWRIIYQDDVYALMSALSWLSTYGRMDEGMTNAQLTTKAKSTKLSMRCERTIDWAMSVLSSVGVQSRKCRLVTADTPTNYDDGHVTVEVKVNGIWKFWDIPCNFYPKEGLDHLNLYTYVGNPLAYESFIADGERDLNGAGSYQMHTNILYDMKLRNINTWISRIYQIPGIVHTDGLTYFYMPAGTEPRQSWLLGLSSTYRVLTEQAWSLMFYG